MADPNDLWPTGPTARFLKISPEWVTQLRKKGVLIPAMETPLGCLFDPETVRRYAEQRERERGKKQVPA